MTVPLPSKSHAVSLSEFSKQQFALCKISVLILPGNKITFCSGFIEITSMACTRECTILTVIDERSLYEYSVLI